MPKLRKSNFSDVLCTEGNIKFIFSRPLIIKQRGNVLAKLLGFGWIESHKNIIRRE